MKTQYLFASLAVAGLVFFASCQEDTQAPNTANKGKEKPTAEISLADNSDVEFTITITPSESATAYGYAIFAADSYEYATIPSAYDIVTKSVSGAFNSSAVIKADETSKDFNVKCILKEYYQICSASIDENGLLSEVDTMTVYIPGAHPDITFKEGVYTFTPATAEDMGSYAWSTLFLGDPFDVSIYEVEPTVYVAEGGWFNFFDIQFRGTYDYSDNTLTFDGTEYGYEQYGSDFGYILNYLNADHTLAYGLFSTNRTDPFVLQCTVKDKVATVTSIKSGALEFDAFQASGSSWANQGVMGYIDSDNTVEFKSALPDEGEE